jgi:ABC-2 type transport system ATP-binding protein
VIELDGVAKSFDGAILALQDVSFSVDTGSICALLGHNGAGKSTTLGIILGMVMPDAGDVTIDGISVLTDRSKALRKVGAIFEAPAFYDYLSGWENLRILMSYSGGFDAKLAKDTVERVGLTKRIHSKVRTYSHGMRQRLALAQSLLPEPEVLLLDEPTDGLDPEGIKWFRDFILQLRDERGMTVLFNSHLLAEVELMCDRVAILHNPNSKQRTPMALWISFDGMKTWPYQRVLQQESVDGPKGRMNYPDGFVSKDGQWLHFAFDDNRHRAVHYSAKLPPVK